MWYFRYLTRRFFRSVMKPVPAEIAAKWLFRTRVMYFISGMAAFSYAFYIFKIHEDLNKGIRDLDLSYGHRQARLKNIPGEIVVYNWTYGQGYKKYSFENEQYKKEYEERKNKFLSENNMSDSVKK